MTNYDATHTVKVHNARLDMRLPAETKVELDLIAISQRKKTAQLVRELIEAEIQRVGGKQAVQQVASEFATMLKDPRLVSALKELGDFRAASSADEIREHIERQRPVDASQQEPTDPDRYI